MYDDVVLLLKEETSFMYIYWTVKYVDMSCEGFLRV